MALEDFTTYVEVDPSAYISVAASLLTGNGDSDADAYVYSDMGVGHFGDFTHDFEFKNTSTGGGKWYPWILANSLSEARTLKNNFDGFSVEVKFKNNGYEAKLNSNFTGNKPATKITGANNVLRYATVSRTAGAITLSIYTDAARTTHDVNSPHGLTGETNTCRYIYGFNTENQAKTGKLWGGTVGALDINEAVSATYYPGLKVQGEGDLALTDVGAHPLRVRKGGITYGLELVATADPNASRIRVRTSSGTMAIRKYT